MGHPPIPVYPCWNCHNIGIWSVVGQSQVPLGWLYTIYHRLSHISHKISLRTNPIPPYEIPLDPSNSHGFWVSSTLWMPSTSLFQCWTRTYMKYIEIPYDPGWTWWIIPLLSSFQYLRHISKSLWNTYESWLNQAAILVSDPTRWTSASMWPMPCRHSSGLEGLPSTGFLFLIFLASQIFDSHFCRFSIWQCVKTLYPWWTSK